MVYRSRIEQPKPQIMLMSLESGVSVNIIACDDLRRTTNSPLTRMHGVSAHTSMICLSANRSSALGARFGSSYSAD